MKIIFFKNCIFVWLDAGPPVFPKDFFNRNGTSRGPPQRLPWPPCPALPLPCPVCHQLHRERAVIGRIFQALPNFCPHRQTPPWRDVSGRGEQEENVCTARRPPRWLLWATSTSSGRVSALVALPCLTPALPCLSPQTDKQTDTTVAFIYRI
jgi:hypothetical protein